MEGYLPISGLEHKGVMQNLCKPEMLICLG